MRLKRGTYALVTIVDGTVVRGLVAWSWRWRCIRLVEAALLTPGGRVPAAGPVLIPHRSVVLAQEVDSGDE